MRKKRDLILIIVFGIIYPYVLVLLSNAISVHLVRISNAVSFIILGICSLSVLPIYYSEYLLLPIKLKSYIKHLICSFTSLVYITISFFGFYYFLFISHFWVGGRL